MTDSAFQIVYHMSQGSLFIILAKNSFNCVSKWMGPISGLAPCREGIWTALLAETECVQGPPITALAWGVKQIDWQA